ncbi:flagellar basal body L-ring protein FlgH [Lacimicrobium sp. SS2-24]|uniref:flagellar basal body L-ring protein FlgH n=1 Tax=Lacimicrobium sp. SS2-24 TaxID=2005569 RepID=UPI000B4ADA19|nr:flagellar basal body L-ring protein FlgH [Lacimicrobium sp. SS2-24]
MKLLTLFFCSLMMLGCASSVPRGPAPGDPFFAPVMPDAPEEKLEEDGSIYKQNFANSLYSDVKARRVGDIITVVLRENTNASKSAGTNTSKESEIDVLPITGLGGNNINIGNESIQLGLDSSNEFSGSATANQSNSLNGNISVTVTQVLPNQNLAVRGEKWLTLNNGDEYIRLTGIVRAADISPENQVDSSKIANARIQYSGTGSFARSQEKGWLTRFFSSQWWPF